MRLLSVLCLALALPAPALAQSLYGVDDQGNVVQFTGPPAGACATPSGPLLSLFSFVTSGFCPTPGPIAGPPFLFGDIATNKVDDTLWVTDGKTFAEYQSFGTPVNGFTLPAGQVLPKAVTGMGFDFTSFGIWITDGRMAAQVRPPSPAQCNQPGSFQVLVPAFPLPISDNALATDIDFDPSSNSLYVCDDRGFVTNVLVGGGLGPAGSFLTPPLVPCGLGPLLGLAVDDAAPKALYVTDGKRVAYLAADGSGPAPATFYTPTPCSPHPAPGVLQGLDYAAVAIGYGSPSGGTLPSFPTLGATGQAIVPNGSFVVTIAGAEQGEVAALFASTASLCPTVQFGPIEVQILPLAAFQLGAATVPSTGLVDFPLPIPATVAVGGTVFLQGLTFDPTDGSFANTRGLALRFAQP